MVVYNTTAVRSNNCDIITMSHYDIIIFSDLNIPLLLMF